MGRETRERLGLGLGDRVTLLPTGPSAEVAARSITVVGEAVINDPVTPSHGAGDGGVVVPQLIHELSPGISQQILARIEPSQNPTVVIGRLARSFPGRITRATPQDDVRNLAQLRSVPWLIAGMIALLALATMTHALVTAVRRHRKDIAIMAVFGLRPVQRGRVTGWAYAYLFVGAAALGVPVGFAAGRLLWRFVAGGVHIPSDPTVPLMAPIVIVAAGFLIGLLVTRTSTRQAARLHPAKLLRVE